MILRLVSLAEEEVVEACDWYNAQQPGLGHAFLDEFDAAITRIRAFPESAAIHGVAGRGVSLGRFPYTVWYHIEPDGIVVYAVMNQRREPTYWLDRLGSS